MPKTSSLSYRDIVKKNMDQANEAFFPGSQQRVNRIERGKDDRYYHSVKLTDRKE